MIVDSSVWIDYFAGLPNPFTLWIDQQSPRQRVGLTDIILCEVLQGFRTEAKFAAALERLSDFQIFESVGEALAVASAQNFRLLRARGITVRTTVDCLIATFCITHGHTLLHRDRDFDPFEQHLGLSVLHPSLQ